jgi:uncharacterized small protein (DUF1192 family)
MTKKGRSRSISGAVKMAKLVGERDARIAELTTEVDRLRAQLKIVDEQRHLIYKEHREEMNKVLLAGMLLMREALLTRVRKYGPDFTRIPKIGIKALAKWVDPGMLSLNPESMAMLAGCVSARLEGDDVLACIDENTTVRELAVAAHERGLETHFQLVKKDFTEEAVDHLLSTGQKRLAALNKAKEKPRWPRVKMRSRAEWLKLATSYDAFQRSKVTRLLRDLGLAPTEFMSMTPKQRVDYILQHQALERSRRKRKR